MTDLCKRDQRDQRILRHLPILERIFFSFENVDDIIQLSMTCKHFYSVYRCSRVISRMMLLKKKTFYNPELLRTPEVMLAATNGNALRYVPERLMTPEVVLAVVQMNPDALRYVPERRMTPEVVLAAVQRNGNALQYVPERLRTPEVVLLAALQRHGDALRYVPESLLEEWCAFGWPTT